MAFISPFLPRRWWLWALCNRKDSAPFSWGYATPRFLSSGCVPFVCVTCWGAEDGPVSALGWGVRMLPRMWNCPQAFKPQLLNLHGGTGVATTGVWGFDICGYPEDPWHEVRGHCFQGLIWIGCLVSFTRSRGCCGQMWALGSRHSPLAG